MILGLCQTKYEFPSSLFYQNVRIYSRHINDILPILARIVSPACIMLATRRQTLLLTQLKLKLFLVKIAWSFELMISIIVWNFLNTLGVPFRNAQGTKALGWCLVSDILSRQGEKRGKEKKKGEKEEGKEENEGKRIEKASNRRLGSRICRRCI